MLEAVAAKFAGSLGQGLGSALGGGGGPFVGGSSQAGAYGITFDKGGQVLNFGTTGAVDTTSTRSTTTPQVQPNNLGMYDLQPAQAGLSPWVMLALGLFAFGIYKRAG